MVALRHERQVTPFTVSIVFAVVATISVFLRVCARRMKSVSLDSSDYCIFIALTLTYGLITCDLFGVIGGGVGRHMKDVMMEDGPQVLVAFLKDLIAIQILWATSLMFIKISILLFYMRIFAVRSFRIAAHITMVLVIAWALSVILCGFLLCTPFAFNWDQTIPGGSCGKQVLSYILTGALNIITDVMVLSLPIPMVWKLQTPRANKIALTVIFGLGFFACIISIVRLVTLVSISYDDITYSVVDALIWSMLEPALGVTLACLPVMRPLFGKVFAGTSQSRSKPKVSSTSGSDIKGFDSKNFKRLDEQTYPLKDVSGVSTSELPGRNRSDSYKSFHGQTYDVESAQGSQHEAELAGPLTGINVKREYIVRHS